MSAAITRAAALIDALSGNTKNGLRLAQLAELAKQAAPTTLRDLQALESIGLAERLPGAADRWRLGPRLVRIALAHQSEVAREERELDDWKTRYSRQP